MFSFRDMMLMALAIALACSECVCEPEDGCDCITNDVHLLQTTATLNSAETPLSAALVQSKSSKTKAVKKARYESRRARRAVAKQQGKSWIARLSAGGPLVSEDASAATTTTTTEYDAALASGVSTNGSGDLTAFLEGDITALSALIFFMITFVFLRSWYPIMFNYNSMIGLVKDTPADDWTSWIWAAAGKQREEHVATCGLDHAMLLEMCVMSMRICAWIALPMTFLMGPLCAIFGKGDASQTGDSLSMIGINNVETGSWLMYLYGPITCLVVVMLRYEVGRSMRTFCQYRTAWLKNLNDPQASTILVESIPEDHQSEAKVREFFGKMFTPSAVKDVDMVLYIPELESACAQLETSQAALSKANQEWENAGKSEDARPQLSSLSSGASRLIGGSTETDAINYWTAEVKRLEVEVSTAKQAAVKDKEQLGGINSNTAFVRFESRKEARVAISVVFSSDKNEWIISAPNPPSDMIFSDLKVSEESKGSKRALGYGMVFGLYVAFTPFCLWVTNLADAVDLGPLQSLWETYAPTLGLLIFLSFVPTVLINVFSMLFHYKSEIGVQQQVQIWYFWFLFFFVILVTCIGQGFSEFVEEVAEDPLSLPIILADELPSVTHYYLNFLGTQWLTHGMNLIRYIQVGKFVGARKLWSDEDAKKIAEPEDQDYYGMGSRSARFTTNLLVVVIMGTMSPLMGVQGWVNFFICRIIYGYLMVYAEGKKADSGGVFFVSQMQHLQIGTVFYVFLMLGLCLSRGADYIPAGFCVAALVYALFAWRKFETDYEWERLPWADMVLDKDGSARDRKDTGEKYIQQELQ